MERIVHGQSVYGVDVGPGTRCAHYGSDSDVIAIRFACCGRYYPCFRCHDAVADHPRERLPSDDFDRPGVLCGACGAELAVRAYLDADDRCPECGAGFNPGCREHYHLYFEVGDPDVFDGGDPEGFDPGDPEGFDPGDPETFDAEDPEG